MSCSLLGELAVAFECDECGAVRVLQGPLAEARVRLAGWIALNHSFHLCPLCVSVMELREQRERAEARRAEAQSAAAVWVA